MRRRASPAFDHARLHWYRHETSTYRFVARYVVPTALRLPAGIVVEGLEHIPASGPLILAANHPDNWDAYLLMHLVSRPIHFAARPDGFGTGPLCAFWRRLGTFPANPWGLRFALSLLEEGRVVGVFPQATITRELGTASGAVGLLAVRSGAPVIPVAILGTEAVHMRPPFGGRSAVLVRFGPPVTFAPGGGRAARSRAVAEETLALISTLLAEMTSGRRSA